ncbi:Gfo/Idh/MocA family protein [Georgenia deserti]|uniref:Gfo/Idh/MocA family protein n=1 Tax=Georgenia deserti TaxID=2093781 RepID=A0ABW4KXX8_9MICO
MASTVRVGILGAAGIAPRSIIGPARRTDDAEVAAVASRSQSRADEYAAAHGIPLSYGDYRRLLENESIDLVYVALPPSEHAQWVIAALEAGKDVLCEKPFAMNEGEVADVLAISERTGCRAIEAFHDEYHPLWSRTREIAAMLGRVRRVEGEFCVNNPFTPGAIRHEPSLGGGALMDLGCYPLHWVRSLMGEEPHVVSAAHVAGPAGADESITAELDFPSGATGRVDASMGNDSFDDFRRIDGERGSLMVQNVVFPTNGHRVVWTLDGVEYQETVGGRQTYDHQLECVVRALRTHEMLPTEGSDILGNMRAIDAIYRTAKVR